MKVRLLIQTCDKHSWAVPLCLHFLEKNFPDTPLSVDILCGKGMPDDINHRVSRVIHGDDTYWSDLLLFYLSVSGLENHDAIVLLLEDYLTADRINVDRLATYIGVMDSLPVDFIRLLNCPGPTKPFMWDPLIGLGKFSKDAPYLSSLQPTLFRVSYLRKMLRPGESAFDFEITGTERARDIVNLALGTTDAFWPVANLIRRGVIQENVKKWMEENW